MECHEDITVWDMMASSTTLDKCLALLAFKIAPVLHSGKMGDWVMSDSPTARRRRLGQVLKQLRDDSSMTIEQAAKVVGISGPHLSRVERAQVGVRLIVVKALLAAYEADPQTVEELTEIASTAGKRGWWHDFSLNRPYATLIGFEGAARLIRTYEPLIIPGLLQTEDYARALLQQGPARLTDERIAERIAVRRQRQLVLDQSTPPVLSLVLDEAAIRRPIGGPEVMRAQLLRVAEAADLPNVDVQVIPYAVGAHPGAQGSFVILSFAPDERDVIYIEGMAGDLYPERQIEWYGDVFNRLQGIALNPHESVQFIRKAAEGFEGS